MIAILSIAGAAGALWVTYVMGLARGIEAGERATLELVNRAGLLEEYAKEIPRIKAEHEAQQWGQA